MKKIIKLPLILLLSLISINAYCQQPALQNKYWQFRDQYRKYFMRVGKEDGESVPAEWITKANTDAYIQTNPTTQYKYGIKLVNGVEIQQPDWSVRGYHGNIAFHDAGVEIGDYIAVIATEYWLLKHHNQTKTDEFKAVKNELYFVLNALERLDKFGETYFRKTESLNGFFVRQDVKEGYYSDIQEYENSQGTVGRVNFQQAVAGNGVWGEIKDNPNNKIYDHNGYLLEPNADKKLWDQDRISFEKGEEYEYDGWGQRVNEMSMDQLIGIMYGFTFIKKFVDADLEVDPDGAGTDNVNKNIIDWMASLTNNYMTLLTTTRNDIKYLDPESYYARQLKECAEQHDCEEDNKPDLDICPECGDQSYVETEYSYKNNPKLFTSGNYILTNPTTNKVVFRGGYAFPLGYPLEKLGEWLTGNDYPSTSMVLDDEEQILSYLTDAGLLATCTLVPSGAFSTISTLTIMAKVGTKITVNNSVETASAILDACGFATCGGVDGLSLCVTDHLFTPSNANFWRDFWNAIPDKQIYKDVMVNSLSNHMIQKLAPASNTWTHSKYKGFMDAMGFNYDEIIYAVLNNVNPIRPLSDYETLLNKVSCYGSLSDGNSAHMPWNKGGIFGFPNDPVKTDLSYYNSIDWMLMYNMWRIASFRINQGDPNNIGYSNSTCPCHKTDYYYKYPDPANPLLAETPLIRSVLQVGREYDGYDKTKTYISDIPSLPYTFIKQSFPGNPDVYQTISAYETHPYRTEYKKLGIFNPDYLLHSATINDEAQLTINQHLVLCSSEQTVSNELICKLGGLIQISEGATNEIPNTLIVRKNQKLILENGSILKANNYSKIVIEPGATLIFHPGAHIILNGPNAVLEIKGKMELKDNAVFKIEGGIAGIGYVQFENHWDAITQKGTQEIVTGNNTRMEFIGLNNNRVQKLLEIRGAEGLWLNTNLVKCTIKNGFVDMRKDSRIISHCRDFEMNEVYVFCSDYNVEAVMHRGIHVLGTPNLITNCEIIHGNPGLRQFAIEGTSPLVVQNSNISECYEGIRVESGNLWLTNTPVQFCSGSAIAFTGTSSFSKVLNCTIENNTNGALDFHGSGRYFTSKSNYRFNRYAAAITEGKVEPRCCLFSFNSERGIHVLNGSFNIQAGYNVLEFNGGTGSPGISKLFSGNKAIWYLENGNSYIDLINKSGSGGVTANQISSTLSALQPVVPNATPTSMPFAVNGNGNCWVQTGANLTTSMYSLTQNSMNLFLQNGAIPTIVAGTFGAYKDQNCNTLPAKMPLDYMMDFINPSNSGTTFSRRNRTGSGTTTETFTNGLNSALTLTHQLSPDYEGSIMLLHDMMGINFPSADRHVWYELYNASQHVYFTALSDSAWQDSAAFPLRQNLYTIMNQKQDALLSLSSVDSIGGYWQPMHFDFVRDKSLLYRSIGQRNTAIGYINTRLNDFTDSIDRNGLVVWQCIYKQEQDYLDSLIPLDSVNLHFNCIGPWLDSSSGDTLPPENMMMNNNNYQNYGDRVFNNKPKQSVDKQGKEDINIETAFRPVVKSKPQILFKIYPNPTDNSATVLAYNSPTETKFDLLLYNNTGTLISQMQFNSSTTLNTTNLSEGVYTVSCKGANGFNFHTKLVVIHRE